MQKRIFILILLLLFTGLPFLYGVPLPDIRERKGPPAAAGQGRYRQHGNHLGQSTEPSGYLPGNMKLMDTRGQSWDESNLKNKIVVMEFWATWCAPCLKQIHHMKALYEEYRDEDVVILGINLDTAERRTTRRWLQRNSGSVIWPQILTRQGFSGKVARHFNIQEVPQILIFNRDGKLVSRNSSSEVTENILAALTVAEKRKQSDKTGLLSTRD